MPQYYRHRDKASNAVALLCGFGILILALFCAENWDVIMVVVATTALTAFLLVFHLMSFIGGRRRQQYQPRRRLTKGIWLSLGSVLAGLYVNGFVTERIIPLWDMVLPLGCTTFGMAVPLAGYMACWTRLGFWIRKHI